MKKPKTAVVVLLLVLTASIVTCLAASVSAAWDGGLTDGNEESTPLPFPRANPGEDEMPEDGTGAALPESEEGPLGTGESERPETEPMTDRETDGMTDRVTDAASETTETEKKAGLSFWAVLGAAGCAAAVAGIVLTVTNKAEKKH